MCALQSALCFFSYNKDEHEEDIWIVFKHKAKHLLQLSKTVCTTRQVFIQQHTHRCVCILITSSGTPV